MNGCGEILGPTTLGYPEYDWHVGRVQYSQCCPESCPTKNSVRNAPSIRERPGILCGITSSIFTIGNGAALLLISSDPDSPGPSHALCFPKEIWTLFMLTDAMLSSSANWFVSAVPFESGGVKSAAAVAASVCDDSDGMAGECWYSPRK